MSGTIKRLDLQFGAFACSVQGFDDPVQPVQQVLQALQSLLEETPELGDSGIAFDAETIERLIGEVARRADLDENNVEIVPGLIIVHRSGSETDAGHPKSDSDENEDWSRPFTTGASDADGSEPEAAESEVAEPEAAEPEAAEPEAVEDADPGYINIFSPGAHAAAGTETGSGLFTSAADDAPEMNEGGEADTFAARLGQMTGADEKGDDLGGDLGGDSGRDIFADTGANIEGASIEGASIAGNVFADPMAASNGLGTGDEPGDVLGDVLGDKFGNETGDELGDENAPVNLFAASDSANGSGNGPEDAGSDNFGDVFANGGLEDTGLEDTGLEDTGEDTPLALGAAFEDDDDEAERVAALFGRSEDQPEVEEADEGYTASGLAQTAGAETVAELMVSAAAWMVLIQGQTTFTRHDVVKVFETMPGEHSKTLEARVKGFGKATRNGQFVMIEDGVFGLSRTEIERFQSLL